MPNLVVIPLTTAYNPGEAPELAAKKSVLFPRNPGWENKKSLL